MPESLPPLIPLLTLLATGAVIGLLAGLLGVGGGVIAVPVLLELAAVLGWPPPAAAALAIGTAQLAVAAGALSAAAAHARAGNVDRALLRVWAPATALAAVVAVLVAPHTDPRLLAGALGGIALLLAAQLSAGDRLSIGDGGALGLLGAGCAAGVGFLAAALGVGAGTLGVPALSALRYPLRPAIGTTAPLTVVVALIGVAGFAAAGAGRPELPRDAIGFVQLVPAAALSLGAAGCAPLGARLSRRAPVSVLRRLFAACLLVVAARMIQRAWMG